MIRAIRSEVKVTGKKVRGRVYADRRVAKYALWLEDLYDRPYFTPIAQKWTAIFRERLSNLYKRV